MRNPTDFPAPLAGGAPALRRGVPVQPSRLVHVLHPGDARNVFLLAAGHAPGPAC